MKIESYSFADAERLRFGTFPVLDTVLYRWARRLEELLFEQFHLEVYAGSSVVEEMRFATFFSALKGPRPVYFFEQAPLSGTGLLVLDNRFANLALGADAPPAGLADDAQKLAPHNQRRLQQVVQQMMAALDQCWSDVYALETHLKKITTYLFRARVLNPYEPCLVAELHLSGQRVSSRVKLCLPRLMLEPVLERVRSRRVIPSLVPQRAGAPKPAGLAIDALPHQVQVRLGTVNTAQAKQGLKPGTVLPLHNEVGGLAIMEVNGAPVFVGSMGEVKGQYAVQISGRYDAVRDEVRRAPGEFHELQWPTAVAE